jgi:hypothetical protein
MSPGGQHFVKIIKQIKKIPISLPWDLGHPNQPPILVSFII